MASLLDAAWNVTSDLSNFISVVHRLENFGAVITHVANETSSAGFHAEWRLVSLLTLDGELVNRCEVFDEADLDAALARFDQLSRPSPRLENTASQVTERFAVRLTAHDWDAMAELLADDFCSDDRRGVVGAGIRHGRDAHMADMRTIVDLWITNVSSTTVATRGNRLVLMRTHFSGSDHGPGAFLTEVFGLVEIDTDERIVAIVSFDLEDINAAFAELESRYLTGEAAAYAQTWSVITDSYAAFNRHEVPATDWVTIDHRQSTPFEPDNMTPSVRNIWELTPNLGVHIESVHRLNEFGAVITHEGRATSHEGFDAEWRAVDVLTVGGELIVQCEVFDEADLDAALARFDQLSQPSRRMENAATRVFERLYSCVAAGDWHTVTQITADNVSVDDRRRVVNAGILHGRDTNIEDARATVGVGFTITMLSVRATRGARLALTGIRVSGRDPEAIQNDALQIIEIDAQELVAGVVIFDLDEFDAAIAELDARYLAGEGAAYAQTWSALTRAFAAVNRQELPELTPDCVNVDHRRGATFAADEMTAYIHDLWDDLPDIRLYIKVVHRLNSFGAVISQAAHGTSQQGFEAEWQESSLFMFDGNLVSRFELFEGEDVDAALARFDQLSRPAPRLENTASRTNARYVASFNARDWGAMASILADHFYSDDRRRITGTGTRRGRDAEIENMRVAADLGATVTAEVIATRGDRLVVTRTCVSMNEQQQGFLAEALLLVETDSDGRAAATIMFDLEAFDAALEELDARYVTGEAAAHAHTWRVIADSYASVNRHEFPAISADSVFVDHRRAAAFGASDLSAYLRAGWDLGQIIRPYVEAVHRLSDLGAVCSFAAHGVSRDGFDAEWQGIDLVTVDGDMIARHELFDGSGPGRRARADSMS